MEQRLISKEFRQRGSSFGTVSWFNQSLATQQIIIIPYGFVISELTHFCIHTYPWELASFVGQESPIASCKSEPSINHQERQVSADVAVRPLPPSRGVIFATDCTQNEC
jgi:hypothetical protein